MLINYTKGGNSMKTWNTPSVEEVKLSSTAFHEELGQVIDQWTNDGTDHYYAEGFSNWLSALLESERNVSCANTKNLKLK